MSAVEEVDAEQKDKGEASMEVDDMPREMGEIACGRRRNN